MVVFQLYESKIDMMSDKCYANKGIYHSDNGTYLFLIKRITGGSKIKSSTVNVGPIPISIPLGMEPTSYKVTGNFADVDTGEIYRASTISDAVNNICNDYIHNIMSVGMIFTVLDSEVHDKLNVGSNWLVTDINVDQEAQKLDQFNVDLSIKRWYGDIS